MIAAKILNNSITPVKTSNTGEEALAMMSEYFVRHLPIVNEDQLLGIVSEDDILDHDIMEPIGSYHIPLIKTFAREKDHVFEVLQLLANYDLSAVPVVDERQIYQGSITQQAIIKYFSESFSFSDPGSILVLDMPERDYYLSEIARIVENENAKILSAFVTRDKDEEPLYLTLKINVQEISAVVAALRRYDYNVNSFFTEMAFIDTLKERYDALMAFFKCINIGFFGLFSVAIIWIDKSSLFLQCLN
jgi:acetoin utilization protein AcuB